MTGIKLSNITKSFGNTEVLKGINLDIKEGEFITLIGASGSGKSTLLRIISGLEQQSSGSITINDQDISTKRPKDRDLAMVFQSYALYPHLSVRGNMEVPLRMRAPLWQRMPMVRKINKKAHKVLKHIDRRVDDVASQLHIEHLLDRKPSELSGGQCQRVALGRAMVREPVAFLMDEPLSNLDAKLRVHMRGELTQLHRDLGTTFVYVTHDQVEAMTMPDRIALLVEGELIQVDTPDAMYNNPKHLKVAEFIGSPTINILPVTLSNEGRIMFDEQRLGSIGFGRSRANDSISIAVRSEDLKLVSTGTMKAIVTHVENMGSEKIVYACADWAKGPLAIKAGSQVTADIEQGGPIFLAMDIAKLMFFDHQGQRIVQEKIMQGVA